MDFNNKLSCILISALLFINNVVAKDLNIFVGFDDKVLKSEIQEFNQCLEKTQILSRYEIEPFITHFPLHITLYLSSFEEYKWPQVMEKVNAISHNWSSFSLKTTGVYLSQSNYVMLDIEFNTEFTEQPILQQLSDATVLELNNDRDFNAPIPPWAESIPVKKKAFAHYGSPNVFFEFSPHFTLFAKTFDDPNIEKEFRLDMKAALSQCIIDPVLLKAQFIGVGEVDEFGQVTHTLGEFPLHRI